jgi:hypothetical protein
LIFVDPLITAKRKDDKNLIKQWILLGQRNIQKLSKTDEMEATPVSCELKHRLLRMKDEVKGRRWEMEETSHLLQNIILINIF